ALSQGVGAFFMSICCTVLPHYVAVYSLFACRGSDLLARVRLVAAGFPSAVECRVSLLWQVASATAGCVRPGRYFSGGALRQQ
ncbi:hypothetical protein P7K49_040593, partial [Saguinus oedipus]